MVACSVEWQLLREKRAINHRIISFTLNDRTYLELLVAIMSRVESKKLAAAIIIYCSRNLITFQVRKRSLSQAEYFSNLATTLKQLGWDGRVGLLDGGLEGQAVRHRLEVLVQLLCPKAGDAELHV